MVKSRINYHPPHRPLLSGPPFHTPSNGHQVRGAIRPVRLDAWPASWSALTHVRQPHPPRPRHDRRRVGLNGPTVNQLPVHSESKNPVVCVLRASSQPLGLRWTASRNACPHARPRHIATAPAAVRKVRPDPQETPALILFFSSTGESRC